MGQSKEIIEILQNYENIGHLVKSFLFGDNVG